MLEDYPIPKYIKFVTISIASKNLYKFDADYKVLDRKCFGSKILNKNIFIRIFYFDVAVKTSVVSK